MSRTQQTVLVGGSAVLVVAFGVLVYTVVHAIVGFVAATSALVHAFSSAWSM
jgi:hypothetical protein